MTIEQIKFKVEALEENLKELKEEIQNISSPVTIESVIETLEDDDDALCRVVDYFKIAIEELLFQDYSAYEVVRRCNENNVDLRELVKEAVDCL